MLLNKCAQTSLSCMVISLITLQGVKEYLTKPEDDGKYVLFKLKLVNKNIVIVNYSELLVFYLNSKMHIMDHPCVQPVE